MRRGEHRLTTRAGTEASNELSYATADDPLWKWTLIRAIENVSGRRALLKKYRVWRRDVVGKSPRPWGVALDMIPTRLRIEAADGWAENVPSGPLVMVANHPFGIADGIALLAIAEMLQRPCRILVNADFMRVPEAQPLCLPIDFSDTKEAIDTNLKTRALARQLIREGVILIVFPAGGVATAETPFGTAEELPWKKFVVRLIRQSGASVLPIYFEGQNSWLFHLVSRYSLTLRLALLVSEFRRQIGGTIRARIGAPVSAAEIEAAAQGRQAIDALYLMVHRLAPGAGNSPADSLLPRPAKERRRFPWDPPVDAIPTPASRSTGLT